MAANTAEEITPEKETDAPSLVVKMAERYGVEAGKLLGTLKATAFKQKEGVVSNEQMMALLVVADQYGLNPFTREIYAFPDRQNGIVPVVGVDGWSRIINQHPQFDGVDFVYSENWVQMPGCHVKCPEWIEVVLYRKDRSKPIRMKEFLDETYRPPFEGVGDFGPYKKEGPWQTHPKRFLRHKSLIQGSRIAFGFVGIYDLDEAINIVGNTYDNATGQPINSQKPERASSPVLQLEQMEGLLNGLINRAQQDGTWHSVHQYMEERFHDQPETLKVARERITDAELEFLAKQETSGAPGEAEPEADQTGKVVAGGDDSAKPKGKVEKDPKAGKKDSAKVESITSKSRKSGKAEGQADHEANSKPNRPEDAAVSEQDYPGLVVDGDENGFFNM